MPRKQAAAVQVQDEAPSAPEDEAVASEPVADAPAQPEIVQVDAAPATKVGTPNNTWTLFYGGGQYDCVMGQARSFPIEVYNYLKAAGNLS